MYSNLFHPLFVFCSYIIQKSILSYTRKVDTEAVSRIPLTAAFLVCPFIVDYFLPLSFIRFTLKGKAPHRSVGRFSFALFRQKFVQLPLHIFPTLGLGVLQESAPGRHQRQMP